MMLDIEIIESSNCEKSLDDALRILFEDYNNDPSRGYTSERVKEVCESAAGKNLDEFWNRYISGIEELPLADYLAKAGVELKDSNKENEIKIGILINKNSDNLLLNEVYDGGSAYAAGLSTGDEIISINGIRVSNQNFKGMMSTLRTGDEAEVLFSRAGTVRELKMKIIEQVPTYELKRKEETSDEENKIWEKWISG
jgi:predicted metalloprotease with PDZ domain